MAATPRKIAFVVTMGALGNVLAAVTIVPTMIKQVALDFSAIPVLIAAAFGGPFVGALTGLIAGFLPSIFFGFIGGQLGFLGFSTSIGKALHGITVGFLVQWLKPIEKRTFLLFPIVLIGFIPECIWIALVFSVFVPLLIPQSAFLAAFLVPILAKAWFEVSVMGAFMSALAGHNGFKNFVYAYLPPFGSTKQA
ncbi:MAG: LytS/YhcK type 5TM receptor domain-containing protein [Candidatus Bathyarchaeia archaeon]